MSYNQDNKIFPRFPEDPGAPARTKTNSMEIHHHGHVHERVKWKEYVFQFLMLFLAVFFGFLAEYQLEHKIEKDREHQFVQSFYEDLSADETDIRAIVQQLNNQVRKADSLQEQLMDAAPRKPANQIYRHLREITRGSQTNLYPNDRTMVQLRNAGGMRLIQNKNVSDSMVGYYRTIDIIQFLTDDALATKRALREKCMPLMNAADFFIIIDSSSRIINPDKILYLRSTDTELVNECLILVNRIANINRTLAMRMQQLVEKAQRIRSFIKQEYRLE